jgi:hypothetical protein
VRRLVIALVVPWVAFACIPAAHAAHSASNGCRHLITDRRGDAHEWFLPTGPYNAEADLLYLDARTSARSVDFTVGMASVNPMPTTGTSVTVYFTTDNQGRNGDWYVDLDHNIDGTDYSVQNNITNQVTPISGAINPAAGTYDIRVPRKDIDATFRGALLGNLGVIVAQTVGVTKAQTGFIEQSTGAGHHYVVGHPYPCR